MTLLKDQNKDLKIDIDKVKEQNEDILKVLKNEIEQQKILTGSILNLMKKQVQEYDENENES